MTDPYRQLIADLPRPTDGQTCAFASFMADAEHWHHRLSSLPPSSPFIFFLSPNAGKADVRWRDGETGFIDRVEGDGDKFPYSQIPTVWYRERFGYWDYYVSQGDYIYRQGNNLASGVGCQSEDGEWITLPDEMMELASCNLTAMVHPSWNPGLFWMMQRGGIEYAKDNPNDPEVIRTCLLYTSDAADE